MTLNVPNLDKLIAHLEAQPPERFNMKSYFTRDARALEYVENRSDLHACGTAACIAGHIFLMNSNMYAIGREAAEWLGLGLHDRIKLFEPEGFRSAERWPLIRAIATLKRLRDHYLATGEIVVDWGSEPGAGEPWAAPQAIELTPPALPAEITRLLEPQGVRHGGGVGV
ncbi:hypothetical protein ACLBYG_21845 [Methylobacterium sp. D53M]